MGYVPKRTLYKLDFAETEYEGLEVVTRSASMGTLLAILELAEQADSAGLKSGTAALKALDELFGLFGDVLVEWNVETEAGEPVAPTKAGMLSQDSDFMLAVIQMAVREMTQAPPPLPTGSGSGGSSAPPGLAEASQPSSSEQKS